MIHLDQFPAISSNQYQSKTQRNIDEQSKSIKNNKNISTTDKYLTISHMCHCHPLPTHLGYLGIAMAKFHEVALFKWTHHDSGRNDEFLFLDKRSGKVSFRGRNRHNEVKWAPLHGKWKMVNCGALYVAVHCRGDEKKVRDVYFNKCGLLWKSVDEETGTRRSLQFLGFMPSRTLSGPHWLITIMGMTTSMRLTTIMRMAKTLKMSTGSGIS